MSIDYEKLESMELEVAALKAKRDLYDEKLKSARALVVTISMAATRNPMVSRRYVGSYRDRLRSDLPGLLTEIRRNDRDDSALPLLEQLLAARRTVDDLETKFARADAEYLAENGVFQNLRRYVANLNNGL